MEKIIKVEVDSRELDIALEKAGKLIGCLKEISQLLASMRIKAPEGVNEPNGGVPSAYRGSQTIEINLNPSVCDADQIMNELSMKLREWTEHATG